MSGHPWFKFYMADWRDGTRGLTWEEAGVYVHLLSLMYTKGAPIDDDPIWICRNIGGTARSWNRVRNTLIEAGKITVDASGKLTNPRAEKEKFGRNFPETSPKLPGNSDRVSNENNDLMALTRARVQKPEKKKKPSKEVFSSSERSLRSLAPEGARSAHAESNPKVEPRPTVELVPSPPDPRTREERWAAMTDRERTRFVQEMRSAEFFKPERKANGQDQQH